MVDGFEHASRSLRDRLAPVVERVLARHGRQPVGLREPRAAMAVWFTLHDDAGAPLVLVSAHARAVNFLLGRRGYLHFRDTASVTQENLISWFEEVLDGALGGGLEEHEDNRATLRTRSGTIALAN
ncbi:MAG TPA: hypothetical protein VNT03_10515 [Baekduia sp.]|nr:hypothetical protein [Baekduia sp.]